MRSFSRPIHLLSLIICLLSCKEKHYQYPHNNKIANEKGMLNDSLGFYFSVIKPFDSSQNDFVKDTFWQQYLSANLYAFKEPILYNDYLGKDQYRFLWLRSFHLPMVFTIARDNRIITLTTKKLDRHPLFYDHRYVDIPEGDPDHIVPAGQVIREIDTLENGKIEVVTTVKADRKANIMFSSTKTLKRQDWHNFEKLLNEAKYWDLKPYDWAGYHDGATWVIEAHTKKGYKYVIRQSPSGRIRNLGEKLITLSGLKEEIY